MAIMSEIKPGTAMNRVTKPFWKVGVADSPLFLLIVIYHELDQVIIVEIWVISEVF